MCSEMQGSDRFYHKRYCFSGKKMCFIVENVDAVDSF